MNIKDTYIIVLIKFSAPVDDNYQPVPDHLYHDTQYQGCCTIKLRQHRSLLIALIEFSARVMIITSTFQISFITTHSTQVVVRFSYVNIASLLIVLIEFSAPADNNF